MILSFFTLEMTGIETSYWIYALGFLGQGLFGARLLVQLYLSERAGKVVSPTIFWLFSVGASFLFLLYGLFRSDLVIIGGQTISFYIYIRNLQLKHYWVKIHFASRFVLLILPIVTIFGWLLTSNTISAQLNFDNLLHPIMFLGAVGQLALNLRFVYQWWYSEKHQTSLLPLGFWRISTWASVLVLVYAGFHPIYGTDPVLLVAQGFGIIVYIRNMVIYKKSIEGERVT